MQEGNVSAEEKQVRAIVVSPPLEGPHGIYFVAKGIMPSSKEESITFSLDAWGEKENPEKGDVVVLSDVRRKAAGWRARSARALRPDDEKERR